MAKVHGGGAGIGVHAAVGVGRPAGPQPAAVPCSAEPSWFDVGSAANGQSNKPCPHLPWLFPGWTNSMVNHNPAHDDCVALAFYGLDLDGQALAGFYSDLIEWFNAVGCPPDKLSVDGSGFSGKPVGFARGNSRLSKRGFSSITSLCVFSMLPQGQIPCVDWKATASVSMETPPVSACFALAPMVSVATLENTHLARLVDSCLSRLRPAYGIGYHRLHAEGPQFYALGMNYASTVEAAVPTGEAYEAALAISRWGDLAMVKEIYKRGLLRDVYPYNYLSRTHLVSWVGGQTLQAWISGAPCRGTLTRLDSGVTLWKVPASQIQSVREQLWGAGLIFDWHSYLA